MGWVRLHGRWGGGLALFALALQLVLSFGHIHLDEIDAKPAAVATLAQPSGPADPPGHDDAAKFCDICATLHSLSVAQVAAPPALGAPASFRAPRPLLSADAPFAPDQRAPYRSRAPPTA
jgi:hypothetical protein